MIRACGCFDGYYPRVDPDDEDEPLEAVAIRCRRHGDRPAEIRGAALRRLDEVSIRRLLPDRPVLAVRPRVRPVVRRAPARRRRGRR